MIKELIYQDNIIITNTYTPDIHTLKNWHLNSPLPICLLKDYLPCIAGVHAKEMEDVKFWQGRSLLTGHIFKPERKKRRGRGRGVEV